MQCVTFFVFGNICINYYNIYNYYKFNIVLSRLNCGIEITVTFKTSDNSLRLTDLLMAWAWGSCRSDPSCRGAGVPAPAPPSVPSRGSGLPARVPPGVPCPKSLGFSQFWKSPTVPSLWVSHVIGRLLYQKISNDKNSPEMNDSEADLSARKNPDYFFFVEKS